MTTPPMTIHDHAEHYIEQAAVERRLSPRSVLRYRQMLRALLARAPELTADQVEGYVAMRSDGAPSTPGTRNLRLFVVRAFVRHLMDEGVLDADPTAHLDVAKVSGRTGKALQHRELEAVLGAIVNSTGPGWQRARDRALVEVAYYTGLRGSELLSLNVEQLELGDRRLVDVRRKGGKIEDVLLSDAAVKAIERWLTRRPTTSSPALFVRQRDHQRLGLRSFEKMCSRAAEAAGLTKPFTPHVLRHTYCTALVRARVEPDVTQALMSHESIATTMIYITVHEDDLRRGANSVPRVRPRAAAPRGREPPGAR